MKREVYSLCFMCSVRCPIKVSTDNGRVTWIMGNPHVAGIDGKLCPRGAAGTGLLYDDQRLKAPMIRVGERGSGNWRPVGWDEALDYTAGKLSKVIEKYGPRGVALFERAQLATHVSKAFMKSIGSPNYASHDALCKGSVNTACRSLFGYTDGQMGMDYKNTRNIVLYGRNIFESMAVKEVRSLMEALEKGARLTYIDPRVTKTATKAHRYWMIRPGTDLALNYALIHTIIEEGLYDREFVQRWVHGFEALSEFVRPHTRQWAEEETGISEGAILDLAREVSREKPNVVFHYGYRGASHENEIHFRRSILILNALMGSIETKGGLFFKKGPGELGRKPARKLTEQEFPPGEKLRFDKVGTPDLPLPDPNHGAPHAFASAVLNQDPYPMGALLAYRFDPVMSMPDTQRTLEALNKLDFVATIDVRYSDIAWYSDIILPESTYLERTDCVQQINGLNPQMFLRNQAVPPRFDTMEGAMILKGIAERMGNGKYFPYSSMDELVAWQLEPTGFTRRDFEDRGFVAYGKGPLFWDRREGLRFKTPSGKIEFVSSLLEDAGFESFPRYRPVTSAQEGRFRLTTGRCALHTHVSTQNNPLLSELMPENLLWINQKEAQKLGIQNLSEVLIRSSRGEARLKAMVTDCIHPEMVFMLHGFGHRAERAGRSYAKGASDAFLQEGRMDKVGGSPALHDTFVSVTAA